jgi:hypothetical protein
MKEREQTKDCLMVLRSGGQELETLSDYILMSYHDLHSVSYFSLRHIATS